MSPSSQQRRTRAEAFLDPRLTDQIGDVDDVVAAAIAAEVNEAVSSVLDRYIPAPIDIPAVAPTLAYWAFDLSRGLHWTAQRGRNPTTTDLVWSLTPRGLGPIQVATIARDVDLAWALGHGRYVEQIYGLGALQVPSVSLEQGRPWFRSATLGHRIDLVLETIRLTCPET